MRESRIPRRTRRRFPILWLVALLWFPASQLPAQAPSPVQTFTAPLTGRIVLDGPWHFHLGDDPAWNRPEFDDSAWDSVKLSMPLSEQGIDTYSGYAWYRLRLSPQQLAQISDQSANSPPQLLFFPNSLGQITVSVNGVEVAHSRGMTAKPAMYYAPPLSVPVSSRLPDGSVQLAIRTWADERISHGLLGSVQLGTRDNIADATELATDRQWNSRALATILASFLFLCVAGLGATLYLAQRNHAEYLWISLLCLSVTLRGALETSLNLGLISLTTFRLIGNWTGWLFMVSTLEFVYRFTASRRRKLVRGAQIAALLVPLALFTHWNPFSEYITVAFEVFFLSIVVMLLFTAWRGGHREAGVMLIPFFLAAIGDSGDTVLQLAIEQHWVPERFSPHPHHLGPIEYSNSTVAYLLFLGSLIAVILYRFIRVSQEEQRSSAEIEAARSVQAMLIPTQLPSNYNFVLESAYFPARGVGGDFFQALPLKDDSMLIVVGDVSGKGLQAAMNASTLVGALRNELAHDPAVVLAHLNQVMLGAASSATSSSVAGFATCLCARIYPTGKMSIANAGHLSPYRDGRELELAASLPLGILPHLEFEQTTFHLNPGDRLTFISDGVVEAANPKGELFGFERTQQVANEPARYIAQTAQRFGQTDDITVVTLYFAAATHPRPEKQPIHVR
jgi:hypothetical protein